MASSSWPSSAAGDVLDQLNTGDWRRDAPSHAVSADEHMRRSQAASPGVLWRQMDQRSARGNGDFAPSLSTRRPIIGESSVTRGTHEAVTALLTLGGDLNQTWSFPSRVTSGGVVNDGGRLRGCGSRDSASSAHPNMQVHNLASEINVNHPVRMARQDGLEDLLRSMSGQTDGERRPARR